MAIQRSQLANVKFSTGFGNVHALCFEEGAVGRSRALIWGSFRSRKIGKDRYGVAPVMFCQNPKCHISFPLNNYHIFNTGRLLKVFCGKLSQANRGLGLSRRADSC